MKNLKKIILVMIVGSIGFDIYVSKFGLWPRYFDIAWEEEVQLHDGRVIAVHVVRNYQRLGNHLSRYEDAIAIKNELSFEFDSLKSPVKLETRLGIPFLDQIEGVWYVVLSGQGPYGHKDELADQWGDDFNRSEQRIAVLSNGRFVPIKWALAPTSIQERNLMFAGMPEGELVDISKSLITLSIKREIEKKYPPHPGARHIPRPLQTNSIQESK